MNLSKFIGEKIRYYRKQKGLTQDDLAEKLNLGKGTISNYESGYRTPKEKRLFELAEILEISINDLFPPTVKESTDILSIYSQLNQKRQHSVYTYAEGQLEEQNNELNEDSNVYDLDEYRKKKTQVNGLLSAGTGSVNYEPNSTYEIEYEGKIPKHDLCFEVSGNSMEPMFENGEIIFVEKTYDIRSGQIIAVSINGEEYVKKAYLEEDHLRLVSLNKEYEDITAGEFDDIRVIGRVIL